MYMCMYICNRNHNDIHTATTTTTITTITATTNNKHNNHNNNHHTYHYCYRPPPCASLRAGRGQQRSCPRPALHWYRYILCRYMYKRYYVGICKYTM